MGVLDGRVAIITGAGAGMGRAAAKLFAAEGAKVTVADRDIDRCRSVANEIGGTFYGLDVANSNEVDTLVQDTFRQHERLDIMYNNAGTARYGEITDETDDNFKLLMGVNVASVFFGMRSAGRLMKQARRGVIINTASANATLGVKGMAIYSATKAAVVSLTKVGAAELAPFNVRVNAICPGIIHPTLIAGEMGFSDAQLADIDFGSKQPIGRVGSPEEVARAALYLASEQSTFVIGHALEVDGGLNSCRQF